jgi:hypothetical protein
MLRHVMLLVLTVGWFVPVKSTGADPKPYLPFNGKDLTGWRLKNEKDSRWQVGKASLDKDPKKIAIYIPKEKPDGDLVNLTTGGGSDIYTMEKFGDCVVELEFMVPQGSNSGIYLMGEYEIQVLDSYGKPDDQLTQGDLGAIYSAAAPKKNVAKKPGEWQKFLIDFQAPKFDGEKKIANARFIKVVLNGIVLHENVEVKGPTPGGLTGKEAATGPLMFQGDHGPVAYRNIKITPKR